jgi:hypothetical protein
MSLTEASIIRGIDRGTAEPGVESRAVRGAVDETLACGESARQRPVLDALLACGRIED